MGARWRGGVEKDSKKSKGKKTIQTSDQANPVKVTQRKAERKKHDVAKAFKR